MPSANWSQAPLELRLYFVFAVAATLLGYGLFFMPHNVKEAIWPYTTQSVSLGYSFGWFFAAYAVFMRSASARWTAMALLAMSVVYAFLKLFWYHSLPYEAYQAYSVAAPYEFGPYRRIWDDRHPNDVAWCTAISPHHDLPQWEFDRGCGPGRHSSFELRTRKPSSNGEDGRRLSDVKTFQQSPPSLAFPPACHPSRQPSRLPSSNIQLGVRYSTTSSFGAGREVVTAGLRGGRRCPSMRTPNFFGQVDPRPRW